MRCILSAVLAVAPLLSQATDSAPHLFYSKVMRGATPEYMQVVLQRDGAAVYRESVDDPDEQPVKFKLRQDEVDAIFGLAEKLGRITRPLESGLKVAYLGEKTIRWESSGVRNEQKFNYTQDPDGQQLGDWFTRITDNVQHFLNLERSVRFDKLGVNKVLLQIQILLERNRLVGADMYLPLLDRVANNESYLNMARSRAAAIAQFIRTGEPPVE